MLTATAPKTASNPSQAEPCRGATTPPKRRLAHKNSPVIATISKTGTKLATIFQRGRGISTSGTAGPSISSIAAKFKTIGSCLRGG